jgi:hypothetical protein
MRVQIVQVIAACFGHRLSEEEARITWDTALAVVAGFSTLLGSILLWEPAFSRSVVIKLMICGLLTLLAVCFAFERRTIAAAAVFFAAIRWGIGALEIRSAHAAEGAAILCLTGVLIYFVRETQL